MISARQRQQNRYDGAGHYTNALLSSREVRRYCQTDDEGLQVLKSSVTDLGLSARAHDKILRVARTIADLECCERIETDHLSEAINFRLLDRQLWT